ncbi:MAG: ribokinase [Hyphomonadaceae bacterium]|nr:ribokinase [Hyphomonadaceae bacterium]
MSVTIGVVGSVNLDLVASGAPLPKAGETVTGAQFAQHPGGKGANQALAARRLGAEVHMVGCVGDDALAEVAMTLLRRDGVDVSNVMSELGTATGVALIAVSPEGENQITVASGANSRVGPSDVAGLPKCDVILSQLEVPVTAVEAATRRAAETGALMAINLAPAIGVSPQLLKDADLLIVNEIEAAFYGDALHERGGLVALTLGGDGAALFKMGQEIARVPAFKVDVVDTTGAGDTFCGALAVALAEGQPPEQALRFASAAAALAVTRPGAQPSLPKRAQVDAMLGEA